MKALALATLACLLLAGCAVDSSDPGKGLPDPGDVPVTDSTGGVRGVVVDQAIRPLKGATVAVTGPGFGKNLTTDDAGGFTLGGLKPGTYFLRASKPLYDAQQQSVEVKAGTVPPVTRIQLTQLVFAKPYLQTLKFKGFIVCSTNVFTPAGGVLSEECGEGVGTPCVQDPVPCGRVGGQANNHVQFDFSVDSPAAQSLVVEQFWEATSESGKAFYTPVSTDWRCDPSCEGDTFLRLEGPSPLLGRVDGDALAALELNATSKVSAFTWASPSTTPVGAVLNQDFQEFVSVSYYLPLPADWSFVKGSPDPFA
jgi:hypothetical protein